uniref:Peptidase C1A papain C-terminal domain-containing protein n=1 Tax=Panagrolaimus davidi TaxID=227884 RepID=A0A914R355_9BILA
MYFNEWHTKEKTDCYPYTISTDCGHPCLPDVFLNPKGLGECRGRKLCKKPGEQAKYVYKITSINTAPIESQRSLSDVYFEKFGKNMEPAEILKREILKYGPAVLCFNVFEGFMHYKKGVYNLLNGAEGAHIYDHCVKIIGWGRDPATGRDYLKAINSWSSKWATDGTFLIDLEMLKHLRSDLYAGIPRI